MIAIWWTQLISSYLAHYKSFVMGLDNPSTHTMFWVNSIALRVTIELGMGVDKGQLLYKEKTSSVPCFQESKAYTLYPTVNYLSHRSCLWAVVASLLTCVCLVLPSYWGFSQLGKKVTLAQSPTGYLHMIGPGR